MDMSGRKAHVEQGQQTRRMPCRARGQLITFQQHDVIPPRFCKVIGDGGSDSTAANNKSFDLSFHDPRFPEMHLIPCRKCRRHAQGPADAKPLECDLFFWLWLLRWHKRF